MRLSASDRRYIVEALEPFLKDMHATIYLFGSRVDDAKRGGDIDLLVLTEKSAQKKALAAKKHYLLVALKAKLGEQKIDLLIRSKQDLKTDHFLQDVFQQAVKL